MSEVRKRGKRSLTSNHEQVAGGEPRMATEQLTATLVPGARFSTHEALYALAQDLCLTYPLSSGRKDAALARGYIALDALLAAAQAEIAGLRAVNAAPKPLNHYFTPDPTKRFCTVCGDNDLGSVWGVHRFQIQPGDSDFKEKR